jgi:UDP-glucose 4-epimerase
MNILITGGLGHIGSYILENIQKIKEVNKIYIIDNLSTQRFCSLFRMPKNNKKKFFYNENLSSKNILDKFVKVDVVINLASITDAEGSVKIRNKIYKNNLGIFNNVVNYCIKKKSKLIHISSTSVYGEQKGMVDETCKELKPKSPYAEIKLLEENILKKNSKKLKYITYRFGTIAGISKGMRFHTAVNRFSLEASLNNPLPIWKKMMYKPKPYLSLKDAFKVIKFTIEKDFFHNDVFNILSENLTLHQIIKFFKQNKKQIKIKYHNSKLINQFAYTISDKKFSSQAFRLKSKIKNDIKDTLKLLGNFNEM